MSAANPNLRDSLNGSVQPGRLADVFRAFGVQNQGGGFGDLVALLIRGLTATEAGVTPSSNVATLANTPATMLQVNVTAGTVTGVKTLRVGKVSGTGAIVPATGECVWEPGTKKVLFAAADAATAVSFTYSTGTEAVSCLPRLIGEVDPL